MNNSLAEIDLKPGLGKAKVFMVLEQVETLLPLANQLFLAFLKLGHFFER